MLDGVVGTWTALAAYLPQVTFGFFAARAGMTCFT